MVKNAENKLIFGGENRQNKLIDENKLFVGRKKPTKNKFNFNVLHLFPCCCPAPTLDGGSRSSGRRWLK
jgi:hypothetical protein